MITLRLEAEAVGRGVQTSTILGNGMITKAGLHSSHKMSYGEDELLQGLIHRVGEMAVVAKRQAIKSKLADRGKTLIFVCYAKSQAKDVYRFYITVTRKIIQPRDVIWLGSYLMST